jgi:hypothetical protein
MLKVKFNSISMNRSLLFFLLISGFSLHITAQQIENGGFENWENAGTVKDEPVDWSTIKTCDDPIIASVAPVTYDQTTDAHSGNYALKIYNVTAFGLVATGAICNGRFHAEFNLDSAYSFTDQANPLWNTPITTRPDSLVGWYKYFPKEDDKAQFKAVLHVDECTLPAFGTLDNWVGMAYHKTEAGVTYGEWTRFSVPFEYYSDDAPEYILCTMNSGDSTDAVDSSYLIIDDLELIYKSSGIDDPVARGGWINTYSTHAEIIIASEEEFQGMSFRLISLTGQSVYTTILNSRQITFPILPQGIYIATLQGKSGLYNQKIMIR